ncbi:unnamed protein product [Lepeophtheirus salmonis]|uniref:(salmon louse) hypothetical protein n=1 Tax=Lepeophtheirus salmonis TaxID=72036 RepID=A0A7R8CHX0_LEPSM|nr:unnamed protein product [Lepeophtheirus salmonis]CAF2827566.1 unnamed protein product [Lepeophtheirus salmonis]
MHLNANINSSKSIENKKSSRTFREEQKEPSEMLSHLLESSNVLSVIRQKNNKSYFTHPEDSNGIFFIMVDPPHLIKLGRKFLLSSGFRLPNGGGEVYIKNCSKMYFEAIYDDYPPEFTFTNQAIQDSNFEDIFTDDQGFICMYGWIVYKFQEECPHLSNKPVA